MRRPLTRIASLVGPILTALAACADLPSPTGDFTCASDGVCAHAYGKKSLRLAYRQQDDEVFIEAVYRPYRGLMPEGTQPWCIRIVDRNTGTFFTKENSSCTKEWYPSGYRRIFIDVAGVDRRNAFLHPLAGGLPSLHVAEDRSEALAQCKHYLEMVIETQKRVPHASLGSGTRGRVPSRSLAEALSGPIEPSDVRDDAFPRRARPSADEPFFSAMRPDENTAPGDDPAHAYPEAAPPTSETAKANEPFGRSTTKVPETSPTEFIALPDFEFRQELALFSKPTKSFLGFGWDTDKHHSAAKIRVLFRKLGTADAWRDFDHAVTANHGTAAGEGAMEQYATCNDLPVTQGYFIWKGECEGQWLTHHFCNDDTAYQVYNAYGLWNGGRHCRDRHRNHRPWCDKPW